ncbi:hypothetical protein BEN48_14530 [Hymenobacter glacialis]|uniref:Uncharacterized protein n=2 Tax=Hymenobacter glacialis TaxID=1908236 RepID=A0A1G1T3C5_9BACT|nr:hypothetical protein BEN48_14530 [Hymenobacter glacialis]
MHMSPTWILTTKNQATDAKLNTFTMGKDTVQTRNSVIARVTELPGIDEISKRELISYLMADVRRYSKK